MGRQARRPSGATGLQGPISGLVGMLLLAALAASAWAQAPAGSFGPGECVSCHETGAPKLVQAWRDSEHGRGNGASCASCHGDRHEGALARARRDSACVECHGGGEDPVAHSYATSKHGLIVRLKARRWDWSKPLAQANYRAPGCAYCHMHEGEHDVGALVSPWKAREAVNTPRADEARSRMRAVCYDCHAPRYAARLEGNGRRMVEAGRMKLREAARLAEEALPGLDGANKAGLRGLLSEMEAHLRNVRLGAGHQSPDYQWWHGQPALDGDLLRIKGEIDRLHRQAPEIKGQ